MLVMQSPEHVGRASPARLRSVHAGAGAITVTWNVLIMRIPDGITHFAQLPSAFEHDLASISEVRRILRELFPRIRFRDERWATLELEDGVVEVDIGTRDPCQSILLNIEGRDAALSTVRRFSDVRGWAALDLLEGDFVAVPKLPPPPAHERPGLELTEPIDPPPSPARKRPWWSRRK